MTMYIDISRDENESIFFIYEHPDTIGECGGRFPADYDDDQSVATAICRAISEAEVLLPKGAVYEIRGRCHPADCAVDFGRKFRSREEQAAAWSVAWYSTIEMQVSDRPLLEVQAYRGAQDPAGGAAGFILLARCKVGALNDAKP